MGLSIIVIPAVILHFSVLMALVYCTCSRLNLSLNVVVKFALIKTAFD